MNTTDGLRLIAFMAKRKEDWAREAVVAMAEELLAEIDTPAAKARGPRRKRSQAREIPTPRAPETPSTHPGVTASQMKVLRCLEGRGAMTAAKLSEHLYKSANRAGVLTASPATVEHVHRGLGLGTKARIDEYRRAVSVARVELRRAIDALHQGVR